MSKSGEETRTRILKACWTLLEQGPDAPARMSDIARAAGVSRQAVYLPASSMRRRALANASPPAVPPRAGRRGWTPISRPGRIIFR